MRLYFVTPRCFSVYPPFISSEYRLVWPNLSIYVTFDSFCTKIPSLCVSETNMYRTFCWRCQVITQIMFSS
jgi:hypothetical protein